MNRPAVLDSGIFDGGVLIVGAGLLGTSLGLALRRHGVDVRLRDADPDVLAQAVALGAGRPDVPDAVSAGAEASAGVGPAGVRPAGLAVVAVPPERVADVVVNLLESGAAEYVTDVASIKAPPAAAVRQRTGGTGRYVGSHPMAGREIAGPAGALADLFEGRPWVICPDDQTDQQAVTRALALARAVGAAPVTMPMADHDAAVALVSHTPHLMAVLMAARLVDAPGHEVRLAGPGIGDVTRVAGGDPAMWTQILTANAPAIRMVLGEIRDDLDRALSALGNPDAARTALYELMSAGVDGRARLPGKHGAARTEFATVAVVVDDRPGQLARLFAEIDAAGANIEDVRIDHSPGQPVGLVEIDVRPGTDASLRAALTERGWRTP